MIETGGWCSHTRWQDVRAFCLRILSVAVWACLIAYPKLSFAAGPNPGEPLYCGPDEGTTFLIVNGNTGIFTTSLDCYGGGNVNANNIVTGPAHGTLTSQGNGSYLYTTTNPNFTGTDTFVVNVTSSVNFNGGPGNFSGGAGNITITLNVIPSATTLTVPPATPTLVPIPPGSVTGCPASPVGGGNGPPPGTIYGCITAIQAGSVAPSHGTLSTVGSTIEYTPNVGFSGTDTFTYQALGIDDDSTTALNSGDVTVAVTVLGSTPTVTSVSPGSGALAGGATVTITGTNFTGATSVRFGTVAAASFTVVSATTITAVAPAGTASGPVDVTVTGPGGTSATSSADQFVFNGAPTSTPISTPTLSGWATILLGLLLGGVAYLALLRRGVRAV